MTQTPPSPSRAPVLPRVLGAALLLGLLLAAGRLAGDQIPRFAEWVAGLGPAGPLVFIVGYAVAVVAMAPAFLLTLAAGAVFGIVKGVAFVFCAAVLGSSMAFLISRHLARDLIERRLAGNRRFDAIGRAVAADGRRIVFLLRLSPAFPFTLLNYALGLTRVRFGDYLLASFGMLPGTLLYVYYGKLAGDVAALAGGAAVDRGAGYYAVLLLGLAATVAVTALVTRTARRALAEAAGSEAVEDDASASAAVAGGASGNVGAAGDSVAVSPAEGRSADRLASGDGPGFEPSVVAPMDDANAALLANVRPEGWSDPPGTGTYDLVVVGAGAGGLISAAVGAGLGARVALVERNLMGGDCLNHGCVPSKALLHDAKRVAEARALLGDAALDDVALDRAFAQAMARMRRVRADISRDDASVRYRDEMGVDVFHGHGRFTGPDTLVVGERRLRFRRAIVATGARAFVPELPGMADAGFLTNETVFNLTERPRRLIVLGAGPIACELAQAMRRFGSEVTIVDRGEHVLPREDADAAALVAAALSREGVRLVHGAEPLSVERVGAARVLRYRDAGGAEQSVHGDQILVAIGRRPVVDGLDLAAAGVAATARGIQVDDRLRTTNPRVFGVGDCCMEWQFTHAADAAAKIAVQNALFLGRKTVGSLVMPWCTYTDPEVAHVGLHAEEARGRGIEVDTFTVPLEKVNRSVCDGRTDGFVRVHTARGSDRLVGATIVAPNAGEMIGEVALAMTAGLGLAKIAGVIHPYPTVAEGIKAAANAWMRTRLTPTAKKALALVLRVQRWRG